MLLVGLIGGVLATSPAWSETGSDVLRPYSIQAGQSLLPPQALGPAIPASAHPLARTINAFLAEQKNGRSLPPTGLTREGYLKYLQGQVKYFLPQQLPNGQVGSSYASGGYVLAAAVLYGSGYDRNPAVLASAMKAMDYCVDFLLQSLDVMRAWRRNPVGENPMPYSDFYTYPVMLALEQFEAFAPKARFDAWKAKLSRFHPEGYSLYRTSGNNWPLVHGAGEFLRAQQGMADTTYLEWILETQKRHFTPFGMFMEGGAPFAYDGFSRYFLTGILHRGYHGSHFGFYLDQCWRGAWTALLTQSPHGEAPTGYRSAHHVWNEAQMAVIHEIYADHYSRAGRPAEAGAFKRSARLALGSMLRWMRPDGATYIVKNRYPIESQPFAANPYPNYSLLPAHMAALAYLVANDSIAERPAPADQGGFAFHVPEFNMAFAHAGGTYVQYMTRGNHAYNGNPTGLLRIHLRHGNPQLGPSDGVVDTKAMDGIHDLNVGPAWQGSDGKEVRLAEFPDTSLYRPGEHRPAEPPQAAIQVMKESPGEVRFAAKYDWKGARVVEAFTLDPSGLTGRCTVLAANVTGIRAYYPMLVFDGTDSVRIRISGSSATLALRGDSVSYRILEPAQAVLKRAPYFKQGWNGAVQPLYADVSGNTYAYRISAPPALPVGTARDNSGARGVARYPEKEAGSRGHGVRLRADGRPGQASWWADGRRANTPVRD